MGVIVRHKDVIYNREKECVIPAHPNYPKSRSQLSLCCEVKRSNRGNNGANESNISSLLDYCRVQPIEDRVSTPKGGGGPTHSSLYV